MHRFGDGSTIDGDVFEDLITVGGITSKSTISLGAIESVDAPNGFEAVSCYKVLLFITCSLVLMESGGLLSKT